MCADSAYSLPAAADPPADDPALNAQAAAGDGNGDSQSRCEDLQCQCFRRFVVHPEHLDAIKRGKKLVEFRSTCVPVPSLRELRLLFCLGARWKRLGMDEMVLAEVTDTE